MTKPLAGGGQFGWAGEDLTGVQIESARQAAGNRRRPIPSPLQNSEVHSAAASNARNTSNRRPPPNDTPFDSRVTYSTGSVPRAATTAPGTSLVNERIRAPNPAKRVAGNTELDDLRSAVTRDALREAAAKGISSTEPTAVAAAGSDISISPPISPNMANTTTSSRHPTATRADPRPIMPRNASIDSTASTTSSASASQRANGASNYRVSQEPSGPEDVAALIAASGSSEAAIQKLINEKNQAASHNAQLWRLVEKQRNMILGLNKDLERSLKEKEKYRKRVKDHLAQSESAPSLTTATQQLSDLVERENSQSPAVADEGATTAASISLRDMSLESRKVSDTSDVASSGLARSDTPQDASNAPSSVQPATPQSANSTNATIRDPDGPATIVPQSKAPAVVLVDRAVPVQAAPKSPRIQDIVSQGHQKNASVSSTGSPPASAASFGSAKAQPSRKAPPAPLDLSSQKNNLAARAAANVTNNIIDPSDSEYEDDPDSAREQQVTRGRRKTREEDDRERETLAIQEMESRSQSKKDKKSKSKQPTEQPQMPSNLSSSTIVEPVMDEATPEQFPKAPSSHRYAEVVPTEQTQAEASSQLPKSSTAPSLLSPGLPMSPRPGDRPMNSPLPRAPNKALNSLPMSPKSGMPGLPLSPRAPRQPIQMPPQTPLSFASPHLARAEGYQASMQQSSSLANQVRSSPKDTPDQERPSTSSEPVPMTPGEIYQGLVTEQYPDLLLPPNALPSIYVKTASSRMKPSRQSYIAPRNVEDNPVFTLAVHERSSNKQLWRAEKTFLALAQLDEQVRSTCAFRERMPDKTLFSGHAPAKIDARRAALDIYFERMLDSVTDDKSATIICKFLSTDAIGASDRSDYFGSISDIRPDTPINKRPYREGYLTKRGKNFGGWKARYFVLDGPHLKYFDNRGGAQLGSIKLQNAQIGKQSNSGQSPPEDEDNQFRHAFLILEPKKKDSSSLVRHVLCAESDSERDVWVEALLQYVDYKEESDEASTKSTVPPTNGVVNGGRSPKLQKSFNDLKPRSRSREIAESKPDQLVAVGYNDMVAGDAPVIGPPASRKVDTPSPPHDGNFGPAVEPPTSGNPVISGPTNLQVISNAEGWGMKPPPTPHSHTKEKKRSIFAGFRGRSSSDLNEKIGSPGVAPQDHYATGSPRAIFGVPLQEAVDFARPAEVDTELPAVVYRCIEYLLAKNAVAEEGIFRLSGSNTVIKALKDRFNNEGDVNLTAEDKYYDIHAVASLLKLYLRELPSSILTRDLHLEFLQCMETHGKEKVIALNVLVNKLPRVNRVLLESLSSFLLSIVSNDKVNKMNVRNGKCNRVCRIACLRANPFSSRHRICTDTQRSSTSDLDLRGRPGYDIWTAHG